LLYSAIKGLGGADNPARHLFPPEGFGNTGFEAHLQVLSILLRSRVVGVSGSITGVVRYQAERSSRNAFFCAAAAVFGANDGSRCVDLLLDGRTWPSDRLPTKADHCEAWLYQRDEGDGWDGCEGEGPITGGGFLFSADLLLSLVDWKTLRD
jgi:hypothetical protein